MIPKTDRICVIGGGPAGLGAAWYLEHAGYTNVTVLEKTYRVGGKAHSISVDGNTVDLGALDVGSSYIHVRQIAQELDAPLRETAPLGVLDFTAGTATASIGALTQNGGKLRVGYDLLKYMYATGVKYDTFLEAPGLTGVPDALTVPMATWLDNNGMQLLKPMFDYACTNFGYGPLDKIPAAYLLRFIDWGLFVEMMELDFGLRQWPRNFTKGYNNLFIMMARTMRDVRTNVFVEGITRHPGTNAAVKVRVRGAAEPLEFDRLIMACALDSTLSSIILDLPPDARSLFAKVIYQPYSTTVCRVRGFPNISLGALPISPPGHVYCMIQPWPGGDATAFYVMNPDRLPAETIHQNIKDDMARIRTMDGKPCAFRVEDMVDHQEWTYFPHVSSADLAAGFYDRVDMLQGESNTYFVGGLLGFETVQDTLGYSESVVERIFAVK